MMINDDLIKARQTRNDQPPINSVPTLLPEPTNYEIKHRMDAMQAQIDELRAQIEQMQAGK